MIDAKKQTANMNTILSINFMDIKVPKVKYLIFMNCTLQRIKTIDELNNSVTVTGVFDDSEDCYKLSDIKDKFIKFVSIHSKITHSIQHTCINNVLKLIKSYSEAIEANPNDIIFEILSNKLSLPLIGKVVPCYIFPKDTDKVIITSPIVIDNFKLEIITSRLATIREIYRRNKTTIYTLKTDSCDVMCDRSDFKLLGKKDRKDLFYVL